MLGKTAGGLFWLYRYLERCESVARLIEAGFRIALARPDIAEDEWASILAAAGSRAAYDERHGRVKEGAVVDFLLRDSDNPSSVLGAVSIARSNARLVRTALTREVWESVNEGWITLKQALESPVPNRDLPETLGLIRRQAALVRGALHGTQLRNDGYQFSQLGISLERASNTARIVDMKYYALLRSGSSMVQSVSNVQWETILRTVSAHRSYRWLYGGDMAPETIARFLILDQGMPRAILFCTEAAADCLSSLADMYGRRQPCNELADKLRDDLRAVSISDIYDQGLKGFTVDVVNRLAGLSRQIEDDYRFYQ